MEKIEQHNKILSKNSINKTKNVILDKNYKFFIRDKSNLKHVLAIKQMDSNLYKKEGYNFEDILLRSVLEKIEGNVVLRVSKHKQFIDIFDNKIIYREEKLGLFSIKGCNVLKSGKREKYKNKGYV